MATKPFTFVSEESGETYTWDKPTPPTDRDIAILVAADKALVAQQQQETEGIKKTAEIAGGAGPMPASGMLPMVPSRLPEKMGEAAFETVPSVVEGAVGALGQAGGFALGGPPGAAAGGYTGGFLGNIAGQMIRGQEVSLPEATGAGVSAMVPGGSLRRAGAKVLAREAGKQAGANVSGLVLQRLMEGKELDPAEAAAYAGMSGLSTYLGKIVDPGKLADREMRRKITQYEADKYLAAAQAKGIKIPASAVNPSRLNSLLEAIGGVDKNIAEIRQINEDLFTALAAKDVGVTPRLGARLSDQLESARKQAGEVYGTISQLRTKAAADLDVLEGKAATTAAETAAPPFTFPRDPSVTGKTPLTAANQHELEVVRADPDFVREQAKLSKQAGADVEKFQEASNQERLYYAKYERSRDPEDLKTAKDFGNKAEDARKSLEEGLDAMGKPELYAQFEAARKRIAKIKELENLITPTQKIPPQELARSLAKGTPFSDDLRLLSMVAADERLRPVMTTQVSRAAEPKTRLEAFMDVATGPVRGVLQSDIYQQFVARPQYNLAPDFIARAARLGAQAELEEKQKAPNSLLQFYAKVYPRNPEQAIPSR
jgi:hypothetical protein